MTHIKLIASDLDGTLLNTHTGVSEYTKKVLEELDKKGIAFVAASGRSFNSLPQSLFEINAIKYAVVSNGAAIYDMRKKKKIRELLLKREDVLKLLQLLESTDAACEVFIDGKAYAERRFYENPTDFGTSPNAVGYILNTRTPVDNIKEFITANADALQSMEFVFGDPSERKMIYERLSRDKNLYLTAAVRHIIEISAAGSGKAAGISFLCDYLGTETRSVMAFGNEMNDAQMLYQAGIGVAVADSPDDVKAFADEVCDECRNDGPAKFINNYFELRV